MEFSLEIYMAYIKERREYFLLFLQNWHNEEKLDFSDLIDEKYLLLILNASSLHVTAIPLHSSNCLFAGYTMSWLYKTN